MLQEIKENTIPVLGLNMSTLAILQAVDYSKFGGDYSDLNSFYQSLLNVTEKEYDRLLALVKVDDYDDLAKNSNVILNNVTMQ